MVWVSSETHRVPMQRGAQRDSHNRAGAVHLVISPLHNVSPKTGQRFQKHFKEYRVYYPRNGRMNKSQCEAIYTLSLYPHSAHCVQKHQGSWRASDPTFTPFIAVITCALGLFTCRHYDCSYFFG